MTDIPGFEGLYSISTCGEILGNKRGVFLKPDIGKNGYHRVILYKKGKPNRFLVHRLVARTFMESSKTKELNHIDGNKGNNHYSNLEWVLPKENIKHAIENGLRDTRGSKNKASKLTEKEVKLMRNLFKTGIKLKDAAEIFKVSLSTVKRIKYNTYWKHVKEAK